MSLRLLCFSDLHCDLVGAADLAARSSGVDVVVAAGDFANVHDGLAPTIDALSAIETPTVLVPGNNETEEALRAACEGWRAATVLHGEGTIVAGQTFFGLGAGVPITPWDWSFDLSDEEAAEALAGCPTNAVLVLHSPPLGHCDQSAAGDHLGSAAITAAIEANEPKVAVCGHIHESWGVASEIGPSRVFNLGPAGLVIEI